MMQQHGKTFQAFLPGIPLGMRLLFVHRPEHIKHILSDGFKLGKYGKGDFIRGTIAYLSLSLSLNRISISAKHARYHIRRIVTRVAIYLSITNVGAYYDFLGDGIFNVNGDQWEQQRHTASYLFRTSNLKHHVSVFQRQADKLIDKLKHESHHGNKVLDMQDFFLRYTLDSFAEIGKSQINRTNRIDHCNLTQRTMAGFGVQLDAISQSHNDFQVAFDYVQTASECRTRFGTFWPALEWLMPDRALKTNLEYLNSTTEQIIRQRQSEPLEKLQQRPDLLSQLIAERNVDEHGNSECRHSAKYLRDFVMNFMIAGITYLLPTP